MNMLNEDRFNKDLVRMIVIVMFVMNVDMDWFYIVERMNQDVSMVYDSQ